MIKFITDSASDIPETSEKEYGIEIMPIPITIGDRGYYERRDFTPSEFYDILQQDEKIPVTSHITMMQFMQKYKEFYEMGYDEIIQVTISSTGSSMFEAAKKGREIFYQENEEARGKINIHIIDSKTYSYGYGRAVVEGAQMAREGKTVDEIMEYMHDYFRRVEVYFSVYLLDYAKKSGRIGVVAAFMGEVLGFRPVISIIDGKMKIVDKVRGEKNIPNKLFEIMKSRINSDLKYGIITGNVEDGENEFIRICKRDKSNKYIGSYKAGASIVINSGPAVLGVTFLGEKRDID